jgi:cytochrome b561/polyisoprenoid-binding protein YceI
LLSDPGHAPRAIGTARYSIVAIVLHWSIAALIVLQVVLAGRMDGAPGVARFEVTQLHKSVGITVLLLSLLRLAWRLMNPPEPLPRTMARWERRLAGLTHVLLYVVMIGMPLTGWIMVSTSALGRPTILFGLVNWPHVPGLPDLAPAAKTAWHNVAETGHGLMAKATYVLVGLHVAGALKHQLFSRDEPVLARMAPGAQAGRWLEPRVLLILIAFVAVVAFGRVLDPPDPGMPPPARSAQPPGEPAEAQAPTTAAPVDPLAWRVQPGSTLAFTTSWAGQELRGRFERWTAEVRLDPQNLEQARVRVLIDLASVTTGDRERDAALQTAEWFDVPAHPQAEFTAERVSAAGGDRYLAQGSLVIRGSSRPLSLPFSLKITGDRAEAHGVTTLDRTRFGVGQGQWAGTDQIPAKVTVQVDLTAVRG